MMFKSFKWALLLIFASINVLPAATYYVSPSGSDSNSGSQSAPWLTVGKAAGVAGAGDIVNIAGGTYNQNLTLNNSGSAFSPITFIGSGNPVVTGNITINGNYIVWSGITCSPPAAGGYAAMMVYGSYDMLTNSPVANYGAAASDQATMVNLNGNNDTVINCVYANMNDIDVFHIWGHDHLISGCLVTNVNEVNYAANHTDFVQTWGSSTYNVLIRNCLVINSTCQLGNTEMDITGGTWGWTFENCIFKNIANTYFSGIPNTKFYNCVFDSVGRNQGTPIYWYYSTVSGNQRDSTGGEVDNTVFYNCSAMAGNGVNVATTIAQTANYSGSSPGFVSEPSANYHLAAGSPLIGKGTNLYSIFTTDMDWNKRPVSGAWDIGAYVYGTVTNGTPQIQVAPGSLVYGTVLVGTSKTNSFTVQNVGTGTLGGSASVSAPFSIVGVSNYNLSAGQTQAVVVVFNPMAASNYNQSISFSVSGGVGTNAVVTGGATNAPVPTPVIQVNPGSIGFGTVLAGTSATNSFTVQNVGTGTLSGNATVASPFFLISGGAYSLGAGQTQAVLVAFSPLVASNYSQSVNFSGGGGTNATVSGSATNAPVPTPIIQVNPGSIAYGELLVGAIATNSFTVKNIGTGTLSGTASVGLPFSILLGGSYNLAAGQTQAVVVAFSPLLASNYNQSVSFSGGGGTNETVSGSATNAPIPAPVIQVNPGNIGFGTVLVGTSATNSFTVKNVGTGTLSGTAGVASPFSILSGGNYSLGAGQAQSVVVVFSPLAASNYNQSVTFSGGGGTNTTVSGSATNAPVPVPNIQVSPSNIGFGTVLVGTSATNSFTVKNIGTGTLSGTAGASAPFSVVSGGNYSLSAGQSQSVKVVFSPLLASNYNQSVSFSGSGGTNATVSGSATNATVIPAVSSISVDATDVDTTLPGLQIYPGTTVQFSATATNAQVWQWSYTVNGGALVVYTNSTSPITNISAYFDTNTIGNTYVWTLVVSNGLMWAESQTTLSVEAMPSSGGTGTNGGVTISAASVPVKGLLTTTATVSGAPISYIYQPLPSFGVSSGGTAVYNFTITNAGNYEIQALVNAPSENANSFYVNIDGQPQSPTMIWDIMPITSGFEQRVVSWRGSGSENNDQIVPKLFNLSAGPHQIVFVGREPYTALSSFTLLPVATTQATPSYTNLTQASTSPQNLHVVSP